MIEKYFRYSLLFSKRKIYINTTSKCLKVSAPRQGNEGNACICKFVFENHEWASSMLADCSSAGSDLICHQAPPGALAPSTNTNRDQYCICICICAYGFALYLYLSPSTTGGSGSFCLIEIGAVFAFVFVHINLHCICICHRTPPGALAPST